MPGRVKKSKTEEDSSSSAPPSQPLVSSKETKGDVLLMDFDDDNEMVDIASAEANEDDEIVREIDVFLSPELSKHLHLMQFPLQQQHPSNQVKQGPQPSRRDKPQAARIKPHHCMVELDYSTRPGNGDDDSDEEAMQHQDYNGQFFMSTRTFSSQTIPLSTHMAMGKLVTDGSAASGLHLIPLTRITQMRPNFHHVNEATLQLSSTADDDNDLSLNPLPLDGAGTTRRPLTFQKKESERAAMARKSSYAYKKASEESEIWIPLEVHAERTLESERTLEKLACTTPDQNLLLPIPRNNSNAVTETQAGELAAVPSNPEVTNTVVNPPASAFSSLSSYVQSLNYLPQSQNREKVGLKHDAPIGVAGDRQQQQDVMSTLVGKMVELMHQGWPIPYSVLRDRFDTSVHSDDVLLQSLGGCAFLVRGNFILQSRLLPLPAAVGQARTFILFLFQSLGVVHRARVEHVYHGDDQVTSEVIFMLLEQVGITSEVGWKLKVDDDPTLETKYPGIAQLHLEFWRKQVRRFEPLFERYRQLPQENENENGY
jgi:DNA-directed RNA polymerase-3 subunit RPC5